MGKATVILRRTPNDPKCVCHLCKLEAEGAIGAVLKLCMVERTVSHVSTEPSHGQWSSLKKYYFS
jgi:hypothetical protein